jgi:ubiquitin C-terminal hydrolase
MEKPSKFKNTKNDNPINPINQQINVVELLDNARKLQNEGNFPLAEYNTNLAMLTQEEDLLLKIQSRAIRQFINFKNSNIKLILSDANKFLKVISKIGRLNDFEILTVFIRSLYRAGVILFKNKTDYFLSTYYFWRAKTILSNNDHLTSSSELKMTIEENLISSLEEISKILKIEKEKFLNLLTKSNENQNLTDITQYLRGGTMSDILGPDSTIDSNVYIISNNWVHNMAIFLSRKEQYLNDEAAQYSVDKYFDRRSVLLLNFSENTDEVKKYQGCYPGPINNINLVQIKDYWFDPETKESYTNVYLKPTMKENMDFVYFNSNQYLKIKSYFKIICPNYFEIERKINTNITTPTQAGTPICYPSEEIEIHLKRIKILLISDLLLTDNNISLIRPRYIQISKYKTLIELKNKIIRCLLNQIATNETVDDIQCMQYSDFECRMYIQDVSSENRKSEIFKIIYAYVNKFATLKIKGLEVSNDNLLINDIRIAAKDILIVEISQLKNSVRKIPFINLIKQEIIRDETGDTLIEVKCSFCDVKVTIMDCEGSFGNLANLSSQYFKEKERNFSSLKPNWTNAESSMMTGNNTLQQNGQNSTLLNDSKNTNNITQSFINCELCDHITYCSIACKHNDEAHQKLHKNLNKFNKQVFNVSDIFPVNIKSLLTKGSRGGLVGLKNLGNTCFMNSALQCLSNCEELTKYFLLRKFNEEINKKNKYGSGGQIAKAYYELIKELWNGSSPYLSPWDFRQIFVGFVKQFAGFSQHDSHEMLAFMLDALHEDLNRVKEKPYFELKERMAGETEEQASKRWWHSHLSRENSIIVDLFHGQYKSVITCPDCEKISITYDPFMYLGLPIPSAQIRIRFKFLPNNFEFIIKYFDFVINETTSVKNIKDVIKKHYFDSSYSRGSIEAIATVYKNFKKLVSDNALVQPYYEESKYEILFYENELPIDIEKKTNSSSGLGIHNIPNINTVTFYTLPMYFVEEKTFLNQKTKNIQPIFYSKPFTLNKNQTVKDFYISVFKYYRKIIPDIKLEDGSLITYENFLQNIFDQQYVENEFMQYFRRKNPPFKFHIVNNLPEKSGNNVCEFCTKSGCSGESYCSYNFNNIGLNIQLYHVKAMHRVERNFVILIEFAMSQNILKKNFYNNFRDEENNKHIAQKETLNIYDCLDAFRSDEKLEKENAWYCGVCKKHQEANKKLEIYKSPNILIVQFKRFKIKTNNMMLGMMTNKKNDSLINFPIDNLDLRKFIVSEEEKNDAVYELVGISQHFGSLSSGHYTALCRNDTYEDTNKKWFHFDDEKVSFSGEENIITPAAYLLFFRKKSLAYNNY